MLEEPRQSPLRAFVLMPFGETFDPVYSGLLQPALAEAGYEVTRADSVIDQQNVLRDIVTGIDRADLVLADLTGLNPNVFYELGIAHGLGIATILITQAIDEVPFDLRAYRVQAYSTRFDLAEDLKSTLREIAEQHGRGEVSFGSPVSDFIPDSPAALRLLAGGPIAAVEKSTSPSRERREEREAGEQEEEESEELPKGFLDLLVDMNAAFAALTPLGEEIGAATEDVATKVDRHASRLETIGESPSTEQLSEAHQLAARIAVDLEGYADRLKPLISDLDRHASIVSDATPALASRLDPEDEGQRKELVDFRASLRELQAGVEPTLEQLGEYSNSIRSITGITSKLDRAVNRTVSELDRLISTLASFDAFSSRGIEIVNEKLGEEPPERGVGVR
jgi:hypothetical protein